MRPQMKQMHLFKTDLSLGKELKKKCVSLVATKATKVSRSRGITSIL